MYLFELKNIGNNEYGILKYMSFFKKMSFFTNKYITFYIHILLGIVILNLRIIFLIMHRKTNYIHTYLNRKTQPYVKYKRKILISMRFFLK